MNYDHEREDADRDGHEDHGVYDSPIFYSPSQTVWEQRVPSPLVVSPVHSHVSSEKSSLSHELSSEDDNHPSTHPGNPSAASPATVMANRSYRAEPIVVTKKNVEFQDVRFVEEGSTAVGGGSGGSDGGRRLRPNLSILKRTRMDNMLKRLSIGFRVFAFNFCLMSLAVMAADKNKGWALDSFYRYKEFRYCLAVNVIGFVYSGLQLCDMVYHVSAGKDSDHLNLRRYFNFFMDQMLAYFLLSASSSAATRVYDWHLNWGEDKFPTMAGAAVGLSCAAFVAFSLSSVISGYTQFRKISGRRQPPEFVAGKGLQDLGLLYKMGRGKLAMELITKEKARTSTFQKRKKSLFKKASELSILCGIDVCVIIIGFQNTNQSTSKAKSETWPENLEEVGRIIANYEAKSLSGRCKTASNISTFFLDRQRKAYNMAQSVGKMVIEARFPDWDDRINCFSGEQLLDLLHIIDRKIVVVDQRLNTLLTMPPHQFSIANRYSGLEQLFNYTSSFQPDYASLGLDWVNNYPETQSNLEVLDNEMIHLQMQPQMPQLEFPRQLIDSPTAVTQLQTWLPPVLPHPSIPRMPFLPPCHSTPWPDLINGGYYQTMDDEYEETLSTMNGFCNF